MIYFDITILVRHLLDIQFNNVYEYCCWPALACTGRYLFKVGNNISVYICAALFHIVLQIFPEHS